MRPPPRRRGRKEGMTVTPEGSTLRRVKDVLWVLMLLGAAAILLRLTKGLGSATALTDDVPWGVWKILNMVAGVALGTGGFAIAFAGHVLGIKKLKPLLRPAILVAFLGYASSCFALFLDIGRPYRIWHVLIHWNEHSFLFEVAWCVMLYLTVTVLELAPVALEESRFQKLRRALKIIGLPVVIAGITFSTLHHTSLGSLFLVSPTRLHDLWYSPLLPVHFFLSAVGAGLMFVVLGTLLVGRLYRREPPLPALRSVAVASAAILGVYLATKVADLAVRGEFASLTAGWEGVLFLVEIGLAVVLPIALVASPSTRRSGSGLILASLSAVVGLILNRLNVGLFGFWRSGETAYVPSLSELAVTIGIPAAAGLVFFAFVERFRVFEMGPALAPEDEPVSCTRFEKLTAVWSRVRIDNAERWSLMAVFVLPVAVLLYASRGPEEAPELRAPLAADATRATLRLDANRDGDAVIFAHEAHQERLGGETSCATCHHLNRPEDTATSCHLCHRDMERSVSIFDHDAHADWVAKREGFGGPLPANRSCAVCHTEGKPRRRETAKSCLECHEEDMGMSRETEGRLDLAVGYADAMHGSCAKCHAEKAEEVGMPQLGECATCHPGK
jgi:Ni/Fe-hydrogenase subunit HybB-like protein